MVNIDEVTTILRQLNDCLRFVAEEHWDNYPDVLIPHVEEEEVEWLDEIGWQMQRMLKQIEWEIDSEEVKDIVKDTQQIVESIKQFCNSFYLVSEYYDDGNS